MVLDDYYSLLINSPLWQQGEVLGVLSLFLLGLARLLPILYFVPFLGSNVLSNIPKMLFAVCLLFLIFPGILLTATVPLKFNLYFVACLSKEVLIGILIGFLGTVPFYAATMAGSLIDRQRGASSLMALDPTMKLQASSIGKFFNQVLIVVFFIMLGPFYFIDAISLSYDVVPPDQLLNASFFLTPHGDSIFWGQIIRLGAHILNISVKMGAPAIIVVFMTDVFLGIVNRLAPQVQIFFLGLPLKSILAIWILFNSWWFILKFMEKESVSWLLQIRYLISSFVS